MKKLLFILAVLLLVGSVSAELTWIPHGYPTQYYTAQDGNDTVVKYNIPGTFGFTLPTGVTDYQYLVVAGGGGGSGFLESGASGAYYGGGGGAGGMLYGTQNLTGYTDPITVVVGAGGAGATSANWNTRGNPGGNSTFNNLTAVGGGYGGAGISTYKNGGAGGSGGGGSQSYYYTDYGANGTGGSGTSGQGYAGGAGGAQESSGKQPGPGGGAGGAAGNGDSYDALVGIGVWNSISGTNTLYSRGGACGYFFNSSNNFFPDTNSGSGGHAAKSSGGNTAGADGIVYIRYNGTAPVSNTSGSTYNQNLLYTPHLCRMYFTDEWGNRLSNLTITATPTGQTSVPASWLNIVLGIPINASMPSTSLSGTSSTDGSITFLMVEVMQYNLVATGTSPINGATIYQAITFYPKDTDYTIKINTGLVTDLQAYPTYNISPTESINGTTINMSMVYSDTSNKTTNLTFYVISGGSVVYTSSLNPSTGPVSASYVANNTKGDSYTYGFNATNSLGKNGVIEAWRDITMKGSGALFDFGLDVNTRMWISLAFIFLFAAMWGSTSVKAGAFLTPFLGAGFFWYIGWLPAGLGVTIFIMSFIGGLYYMRGQENKTVEA